MRQLIKVRLQTLLTALAVALGAIGLALVAGGMGGPGGDCGTPETGACCSKVKHGTPKGAPTDWQCSCTVGVACPPKGSSMSDCCTSAQTCIDDVCQ